MADICYGNDTLNVLNDFENPFRLALLGTVLPEDDFVSSCKYDCLKLVSAK